MLTIDAKGKLTATQLDWMIGHLRATSLEGQPQETILHSRDVPQGVTLSQTGPNTYELRNGAKWIVVDSLPANMIVVQSFGQTGAIYNVS